MTDVGFIAAGYVTCAVAIAGYAWRIVSKGRKVSATVPEDRRRWT